jgi:hypothetical protein
MSTTSEAGAAGRVAPTVAGRTEDDALSLVRWTVSSGSNMQSRGAVVIAAGDHQWEGSAEGNGPVDALFRAVDRAIVSILAGHPRLMGYDVHSLGEGPDAEGLVKVRIAPPSSASGRRGTGHYHGHAQSPNIIAASIEAYIEALNHLLGEEHWAGATEAAGRERGDRRTHQPDRAQLDEDEAQPDTTAWFNR